ncbi:MAG: 8-amino-7-oxononanoate synthase [Balneolaceae bacterium]|nr:8-amino-7-oxononanoate synthase [Balneolaceae bacterium]
MSDPSTYAFTREELERRRSEHRLRELRELEPGRTAATVRMEGKTFLNFSSNDYLGLSRHPLLAERAADYARRWGAGATASRLVTGSYAAHRELEEKLAAFFGREACLLFNSGFQANSSLVGSLTTRHSTVICDRLGHNSLLQGSLASRARLRRFEHNDPASLERELRRAGEEDPDRILILTESIFSMDGDRAPLAEMAGLARKYGAMLFADDAHATGAWGEGGRGVAPGVDGIDLVLGTFGKAFGCFGAYLLCSADMKEYLVNVCPGFIYTTALPPPVLGAIDAALELMPGLEDERARLHRHARRLREVLQELGCETGASDTQIVPLVTGSEQSALQLAGRLEEGGVLAPAIRPPTVPDDASRIRFSLSSAHEEEHLDHLLALIGEWKDG